MSEWKEVQESSEMWDLKKPIEGIYKSMKTNIGKHKSNVYMISTGDELVGVWGSTVLDSKFEQVDVGSEVRIEYLGLGKTDDGTEYKTFRLQYKPVVEKVVDPWKDSEEL